MFKVKHKLCPDITSDIFKERTNNQYNLRNRNDFVIPRVHTVYHGTESIIYLGPKIWDIFPEEIKQKNFFLKNLLKWKPIKCPCRLCKVYLDGVGFINSTYIFSVNNLFHVKYGTFFFFSCQVFKKKNCIFVMNYMVN